MFNYCPFCVKGSVKNQMEKLIQQVMTTFFKTQKMMKRAKQICLLSVRKKEVVILVILTFLIFCYHLDHEENSNNEKNTAESSVTEDNTDKEIAEDRVEATDDIDKHNGNKETAMETEECITEPDLPIFGKINEK